MAFSTTPDRIDEVVTFMNEHGLTKTIEHFKIKEETLNRYLRAKSFYETQQPKVLLLDIETARIIGGFWQLGKQYITHQQIIKDWFILGWSAKWLFDQEIMSDFVTSKEARERNDSRICKSLWNLINDSDIIITHNGNAFDLPKANTRFILNGLKPPLPYQAIDTCKVGRKHFRFSSNSLNYLGKLMIRKEKLETNYQLWIDCEEGDAKQLKYMEKYCEQDVTLLEEVYIELRPWIKSHPNLPLIMQAKAPACPNCGSFNIEETDSYYYTPMNRYETVRCKDCGAVSHKRSTEITPARKNLLLRSDAR